MKHDVQDAYDAYRRALATGRASWHPMLAAIEGPPGVWRMTAQFEHYGWVRIVRIRDQVGYRAELEDGLLLAHFTSLRAGASALHAHFLAEHSRAGGVNG